MATSKSRYRLEGFPGAAPGSGWFLRIVSATKSRGSNKFAVTESYSGGPHAIKRAAQSLVNGLNVPVVRLDFKTLASTGEDTFSSWVFRPHQKPVQIGTKEKTPLE